MRIGILTFHRSINYGAFMQSYALSNELQMRYPQHIVEIIDFEYLKKYKHYKSSNYSFPFGIEYLIKYNRFQQDLRRLPLSEKTFITDDTTALCEYIKKKYDVVIVGSDAVWTYQGKMPVDNPYWLFGDKLKSVIKISYAASAFSTKFDSIPQEERDIIKDRLSSFYYIGVRDSATKKFVDSLVLDKETYINHDPTFFLNPADNVRMAKKTLRKNFIFNNKKCISFMTREQKGMNELRMELHKSYNLLHFFRRDRQRADLFDFRIRFMNNVSPFEWYNLYGQMSLNFTNFFHGACLGIINHVPTIVIDDFKQDYTSKYAQLMMDLGLDNRLFYKKDLDVEKLLDCTRYCLAHREEEVNRISKAIDIERRKSQSFFEAVDRILK